MILQPKISSQIFPGKRISLWNTFYSDLVMTKRLDGKKFWEFREFYSPGHFIYKREGFTEKEVQENLHEQGIVRITGEDHFFLIYKSKRVNSIESLSATTTLDEALNSYEIKASNVMLQGENFVLLEKKDKQVILIFLLNNDEMMRANGFFDYAEEDKELVKGKKWFVVSLILLD